MNKRQVSFSTLFILIKDRKPFSILGIVFTFVSIFVLIPFILILSSSLKEPYENYDYDKIENQGIEKYAKVSSITELYNVTINGEHPKVISYNYEDNGQTKSDKFQTMDLEKIESLNVGDKIKVKIVDNQSRIVALEPFSFPFHFFYILPLIFLLIGIPFLLIGVIPALRDFDLYKNGIIKEASIISMTPNTGMSTRNSGQSILVNYYYTGKYGNQLFGKASSTNLLLLTSKKIEDKIKIFVSEEDENKSCLVPELEAMKNNWNV